MPTLSDALGRLVTYGCRIGVRSTRYNVNHHGIVTYIHWVGGVFYVHVIHNTKEWGVQRTSLEDFTQGLPFYVITYPQNPQHAENIVAIAVANLQKPYSVLFQNCEHFCNYCYRLEKRSESVDRFFVGSLVIGGFVAAAFVASHQRQ